MSSTTTTTPPFVEALHLLDMGAATGRCGIDGEFWLVGKSPGVPDEYVGQAPIYKQEDPQESAGGGYVGDPTRDIYYLFFGLDCLTLPEWGQPSFTLPQQPCGDQDVECHLKQACWARIQCEGIDLLTSMWLVSVFSPEWKMSCRAFARLESTDPYGPPDGALWKVKCPDSDAAIKKYLSRPLSISLLLTTTTFTSTTTTVSTTTTTTIYVAVNLQVFPTIAMPCNRATFTPVVTSGILPPMTYIWTWGSGTPSAVQATLQRIMDAANNGEHGAGELSLSLESLAPIVAQGAVTVEVKVAVVNREGTRATASGRLQVRQTDPPPTVAAEGPTVVQITPDEEMSLSVKTGETAPACSSREVAVRWEYTNPRLPNWRNLTDTEPRLASISPLQRVLVLPPFTFAAGSLHMFRAYVSFTRGGVAVDTGSSLPPVVFRVIVGSVLPPAALVRGPRVVSRTCGFALRAEVVSVHAALPSMLLFRWTCTLVSPVGFPAACLVLPNYANASKTDGSGLEGDVLSIPGGQLMAGLYSFSMTVRRQEVSGGFSESTATRSVQLLGDVVRPRVPPVVVFSPWEDRERVSVSTEMGIPEVVAAFEAVVSTTCSIPNTMNLQWVLVHLKISDPLIVAGLASVVLRESSNGKDNLNVSTTELPGQRMLPGELYKFALVRADDAMMLSVLFDFLGSEPPEPFNATASAPLFKELDSEVQDSFGEIKGLPTTALGYLSASVIEWSPAFIADRPPDGGRVSVLPVSGYALRTSFTVVSSDWSDDQNVDELEYTFYSLPATAGSCSDVEWLQSSGPTYWSRVGGRLLREWSPSPSLEGLRLPVGRFTLVVRARDRLGATSAACSDVPVDVALPLDGLSYKEVKDLFSGAVAASSANQLLTIADTVASVVGDGALGANNTAVVAEVVDLLELAVQIMDPLPQTMEQLGLAVSRVVDGAGGATLGFGGMDRVLDFVGRSLVLFTAKAPGGLAKGSGDALLGGLLSVEGALLTPKASREEEKQAEAASLELQRLVEAVGTIARRGLALNAVQELAAAQLTVVVSRLATAGAGDLQLLGLRLPRAAVDEAVANARARRRRLQASSCEAEAIDVTWTVWLGRNPYRHVANQRAYNAEVLPNATVVSLRFYVCGEELTIDIDDKEAPLRITTPVVQPLGVPVPDLYKEVTTCLFFERDPAKLLWVDKLASSALELCGLGAACTCLAYRCGGSFTAINTLVPYVTVTTTTTTTVTALVAVAPQETASILGVVLAVVLSAAFLGCICVWVAVWRWRRRRKLSRVANIGDADDDELRKSPKPELLAPQEEDEELRRQAEELKRREKEFQELRQRALDGDASARKKLLTTVKVTANPSPQLIAAMDELSLRIKRERKEAMVRDRLGGIREVANAYQGRQSPPLQPEVLSVLAAPQQQPQQQQKQKQASSQERRISVQEHAGEPRRLSQQRRASQGFATFRAHDDFGEQRG